jgi:predicted Zn-ribbon and HTH transcriptional regulator
LRKVGIRVFLGIPERCPRCSSDDVEDELHFLLLAVLYIVRERV